MSSLFQPVDESSVLILGTDTKRNEKSLASFIEKRSRTALPASAATLLPAMWAWLEADLKQAQANRTAAPWIVVNGHRPLCAPLSAPTRPLAACHA